MTDEQFAAEVRQHQRARWRPASLLAHAKAHAQDFAEILGHPLTPTELDGLSRAAIWSWDRLFTELDKADRLSYIFLRCDPLSSLSGNLWWCRLLAR